VTLHELRALTAHWRETPPAHVSVAALLGTGGSRSAPREVTADTVSELTSIAGPALPKFQPRARMQ